ncbi:DUF4307 domain-containing protein [Amycolatopsis cihanbeyliensis]|uniref:Uncharacterized protein DUF4307 n=1 Tax=Amycolatopsis cihanbeyliensis TaxID=1128664 RepID=A0A542DHW0_AMYCI|nr:DUF4307 domain-containing protein [Amycolatopsis cihanbeyliensis]TQJ02640.1 uncharacterized protein DUF4307 [Amycolatopsis cihanbeyliensis]
MSTHNDAGARPTLPEGRYGRARTRTRRGWRVWVVVLIALAVSGTVAYVAYRNLGTAPIEAQRLGFTEKPGNAMEITIGVNRDDPGRAGVCIVRVRDISGSESGRKEIVVPPGAGEVSTVIKSIRRPVTADVFGCSYDVPQYLSSP